MQWIALTLGLALAGPAVADDQTPASPPDPPAVATAPETPWEPRARVTYSNFLALRVNPLGLLERVRFSWRHRLYERSGALWEGAWVDLGVELNLPPTYGAVGPRIEVRPLAVLGFSATYEFIGYFGVIDAVMPIGSTQDDFWEQTLSDRGDAGDNYAAVGSRLTLSALVQAAFKGFVLRNTVSALRLELNLRDGATMFYDATQDLVFPSGGWAILNDLDVGGNVKKSLFGVRYSYADALHGTGGPGDLPMHRVGPLFAYVFHDRPAGARFDKPTLLALLQWYPQHPYRSGQRQHAAIPYFAVAFQFEGDLWVSKR